MGKKLKQRKRKAERKEIRKQWAEQQEQSRIPSGAAINSAIEDFLERQSKEDNFRVIFSKYNHAECELTKLQNTIESKSLIKLLDRITQVNNTTIAGTDIVRDDVNQSGNYASLYNGLSPDVQIKEAKFAKNGRLFFYIYQNLFCLVAVKAKHVEY